MLGRLHFPPAGCRVLRHPTPTGDRLGSAPGPAWVGPEIPFSREAPGGLLPGQAAGRPDGPTWCGGRVEQRGTQAEGALGARGFPDPFCRWHSGPSAPSESGGLGDSNLLPQGGARQPYCAMWLLFFVVRLVPTRPAFQAHSYGHDHVPPSVSTRPHSRSRGPFRPANLEPRPHQAPPCLSVSLARGGLPVPGGCGPRGVGHMLTRPKSQLPSDAAIPVGTPEHRSRDLGQRPRLRVPDSLSPGGRDVRTSHVSTEDGPTCKFSVVGVRSGELSLTAPPWLVLGSLQRTGSPISGPTNRRGCRHAQPRSRGRGDGSRAPLCGPRLSRALSPSCSPL